MGGSRRRLKRGKPKAQVGLPKKKFKKPSIPEPVVIPGTDEVLEWDPKGSQRANYRTLGFASDPNARGPRQAFAVELVDSTKYLKESEGEGDEELPKFSMEGEGDSDDDPDDVREALGKGRRDGKHAPLRRLTTPQVTIIEALIKKHGNDCLAMSRDIKLNAMQHSRGALEKLCERYYKYEKPLGEASEAQ